MTLGGGDSLSGDGSVVGDVINGGRIRPGRSPGVLTVEGGYTQTAAGVLEIEIAGPQADQRDALIVTGLAELDGVLEVKLDGYMPALGETFSILTCDGRHGAFDSLMIEGAPAGFGFDVAYGETAVVITAVPEPATLALLVLGGLGMIFRRRAG